MEYKDPKGFGYDEIKEKKGKRTIRRRTLYILWIPIYSIENEEQTE